MSKYLKELSEQYPNMRDVRRVTKEILDQGGNLAFEEIHEATSLERLKRFIREEKI
jgi:hypothetical protein